MKSFFVVKIDLNFTTQNKNPAINKQGSERGCLFSFEMTQEADKDSKIKRSQKLSNDQRKNQYFQHDTTPFLKII